MDFDTKFNYPTPKTPRSSPRLRIKESFKKTFFKSPPVFDVGFPTSLSPISTIETHNYPKGRALSFDYSPTPTLSSNSSLNSAYSQSPSGLTWQDKKHKGPRIKPYIYTQSQQPHHSKLNKRVGSHKCFICDELIQSKLDDENILELKCGDFVHEQCLKIQVIYNIDKSLTSGSFTANKEKLAQIILPVCEGKSCERFTDKIEFVDEEYFDSFLKLAISKSIDYDRKIIDEGEMGTEEHIFGNPFDLSKHHDQRISIIPTQGLKPAIDLPLRLTRDESMFSYRSSIQSTSPSPTLSTINTLDIKMAHHQLLPLEDLKDKLLQNLMSQCTKITLATLSGLGNLRLADSLLIKWGKIQNWDQKNCFLFNKYLVAVVNSSEFKVVDLHDFNISIENGWVKVLGRECVWINSSSPLILEKWCIGLLDCSFNFPSEYLTSTLEVRESTEFVELRESGDSKAMSFESSETYNYIHSSSHTPSLNSASTIDQTRFKFHSTSSVYLDEAAETLAQVTPRVDAYFKDSDSDMDSDDEKIQNVLHNWGSLIKDVEKEISRHY